MPPLLIKINKFNFSPPEKKTVSKNNSMNVFHTEDLFFYLLVCFRKKKSFEKINLLKMRTIDVWNSFMKFLGDKLR